MISYLHMKILMVERMVVALEHQEKYQALERDAFELEEELEFQKERLKWLQWAMDSSQRDIEIRLKELEDSASDILKEMKYGPLKNINKEDVKKLAYIEDMEVALEKHPCVVRNKLIKNRKEILKGAKVDEYGNILRDKDDNIIYGGN